MSGAAERVNLLGMNRAELEAFVSGFGAKPYRARQLLKWIYRRGESDFSRMTDLAKDFRAELARRAEVRVPEIVAASSHSTPLFFSLAGFSSFSFMFFESSCAKAGRAKPSERNSTSAIRAKGLNMGDSQNEEELQPEFR